MHKFIKRRRKKERKETSETDFSQCERRTLSDVVKLSLLPALLSIFTRRPFDWMMYGQIGELMTTGFPITCQVAKLASAKNDLVLAEICGGPS